jgi:hypothetical protein
MKPADSPASFSLLALQGATRVTSIGHLTADAAYQLRRRTPLRLQMLAVASHRRRRLPPAGLRDRGQIHLVGGHHVHRSTNPAAVK